jgi:hypothetical protein
MKTTTTGDRKLHEPFQHGRRNRRDCRAEASWQLLWNNPKIHTPERRKVWLACGEHREWLEDYLQTRGRWKDTVALEPTPATGGTG